MSTAPRSRDQYTLRDILLAATVGSTVGAAAVFVMLSVKTGPADRSGERLDINRSGTVLYENLTQRQLAEAVPIFSRIVDGPAFMLSCLNSTDTASIHEVEAIRIDGQQHEKLLRAWAGIDPFGPVVDPGGRDQWMVLLSQSDAPIYNAALGASTRETWAIQLSRGAHRVAFKCGGNWTSEISFFWEDGPPVGEVPFYARDQK